MTPPEEPPSGAGVDRVLEDPPGMQPQGLPQVLRVVQTQKPPPHIDTVRAWIAAGLIGLLAGVIVTTLIVWSRDEAATIGDMTPIVTAVIAMVGPILGFYFSTKNAGGDSD